MLCKFSLATNADKVPTGPDWLREVRHTPRQPQRRLLPMKFLIAAATLSLLATAALAQSPYAGIQIRPIKALSEQQVVALKAGRGMGLALAAELNGYPGPIHVLQLSDKLGLTPEQKARVQSLFDST
jgi:hypothetical protein